MRTDHLRIAMSLALRLGQLREAGAGEARAIERLLFPIARSIPNATESGQLDTDRIRYAAETELAILEDADRAERHAAAARLSDASMQHRLWGRPVLIDTAAAGRAIR
jgi:hypothetical protein